MKKRNWYLTIGLAITAFMFCYMILGFFWTPYNPGALSAADKLESPSLQHPFGCDQLGRDVLSRTLDGAGTTLIIALSVLAVGFVFGLLIGALCGYYGGIIDAFAMRICDAITLIGSGTYNLIAALGVLFIPSFARLVRGEFIKYRDRDFVQSARLAGVPTWRIIFVHILPNTWTVLLSGMAIGFNNAVLSEASMSFLGIGVGPGDASLGRMLSEAQSCLFSAPWCTLFPAAVVILLVLGIGLIGEGLRERIR